MSNTVNAANDIQAGRDALRHFHNRALSWPENYSMEFAQFVDVINARQRGQFLEGFGFAISAAGVPESRIKEAMENLAVAGQGRLPSTNAAFFQSLTQSAVKTSFIQAVKSVTSDSASDIGKGLAHVGDTIVETAKNAGGLVTVLPFAAFIAIGYFVFLKAKKFA